MRKLIILFAFGVLLTSCNPSRWCAKHAPPIDGTDTTTTEKISEFYEDTTVTQKPDSSSILALIECRENVARLVEILSSQRGDRVAEPQIAIKDNVLTVNCKVDSMEIYMKLKRRIERKTIKTETRAVKVINQPTGFQTFRSWGFWIYTAILLIWIAILGIKNYGNVIFKSIKQVLNI